MKRLAIITVGILLISMSITTAVPSLSIPNLKTETAPILAPTGTFEGIIHYKNATIIGSFHGNYNLLGHSGQFNGEWSAQWKNQSYTGTIQGGFWRSFVIGKSTIDGQSQTLRFVGFIKTFSTQGVNMFNGRFMSLVTRTLYFEGIYT